jgi:hypothetical protein
MFKNYGELLTKKTNCYLQLSWSYSPLTKNPRGEKQIKHNLQVS